MRISRAIAPLEISAVRTDCVTSRSDIPNYVNYISYIQGQTEHARDHCEVSLSLSLSLYLSIYLSIHLFLPLYGITLRINDIFNS